ncbi:hypothetical protein [Streptomyces sp. WAC08401]|uniref:hypothetical protein n=1 Tax=Streptomyces sp. WAC08401 TaxID=2487413 RepID=UPI000FB74FB2|nr:hypothetical protein [Streptomyces sp. WAC08401]RSS11368.1 hypothetical protein EF915_24785 [Streptomyces sp. WAC08401]
MTDLPYTDDDARAEAAAQLRSARDPEFFEINIEGHKIPSRGAFQWDQLGDVDFHDANREIGEHVEYAVDLTRWSVDLGATGLKATSELAWGRGGDAWDLAVQIAHRPALNDDLREAITAAIRSAVNHVLHDRGIDDTHLLHQATPASKESAS